MLKITKARENNALTVTLEGRLDTTTAPLLEAELKDALPGVAALTVDMRRLEYISSAGLRVLLSAQKVMNKQGNKRAAKALIMKGFPLSGVITLRVTGISFSFYQNISTGKKTEGCGSAFAFYDTSFKAVSVLFFLSIRYSINLCSIFYDFKLFTFAVLCAMVYVIQVFDEAYDKGGHVYGTP